MATSGPAQAKNAIRKSLFGLLGSKLTPQARDAIWAHFDSRCAYCRCKLVRSRREGDIDHLVAVALGGREEVANFVLACKACNGDEKRGMGWKEFLRTKVPNPELRRKRAARIRRWVTSQRTVRTAPKQARRDRVLRQVEREARKAITAYETAVAQVRAIREQLSN